MSRAPNFIDRLFSVEFCAGLLARLDGGPIGVGEARAVVLGLVTNVETRRDPGRIAEWTRLAIAILVDDGQVTVEVTPRGALVRRSPLAGPHDVLA